jgi:hypothetical protein
VFSFDVLVHRPDESSRDDEFADRTKQELHWWV